MNQEAIHQYFSQREGEFIDIISQLIAVKSVREDPLPGMPFGKGPADALALALQIAGNLGFSVQNHDNYVGTADLNDRETRLGILCHLDVVGEGTSWDTPPYTAVVKDGLIFGRGSSDNKGPAVAALLALKAVKDLGIPLKYNTRLILGTDEESGSSDIAYYFKKEKTPEFTFSPDGTFPVTNTEKGGLRPTFSKSWAPSEALPRVVSVKGGYRLNVIPPEAEALVEGLSVAEVQKHCDAAAPATGAGFSITQEGGLVRVSAHGKAEHASTPDKGINAITALLTVLAGLPCAESEGFSTLKELNTLFPHGDYYGEAAGIAQSDEISGRLTLSFNIFDMTLSGFTGRFDSRTPLCTTRESSQEIIARKFSRLGIAMEGGLTPPHHTPSDSHFVKTLLSVYEQYTGRKGSCEYTGGGTYVHNIEGGVCFGACMPEFEPYMHGANERMSLPDLITAAKIYTQVIIELCS